MTLSLLLTSIGKKYITACTGFLLGVFLVVHLAGNAASFFGRGVYEAYAGHLNALGPFLKVPETILALLFIVHVATSLLLVVENRKARPYRYAVRRWDAAQVHSATMPYTGVVILVFVLVHLSHFHFAGGTATLASLVRATLSQPVVGLSYATALIALGLHLSHGFWSLLHTFGINHPRYNDFLVLAGLGGGIFVSGGFLTIVLCALLSDSFLL